METVNKATGTFTVLTTVSLGAGIAEDQWYRLTMDVVVSGTNVVVTGKVFKHTTATNAIRCTASRSTAPAIEAQLARWAVAPHAEKARIASVAYAGSS